MRVPGQSLFSTPKIPAAAPIPPIPEPALAPDPQDIRAKIRKRREFAIKRQGSGRLSTIRTGETVLG